jgi:hypothetical protein
MKGKNSRESIGDARVFLGKKHAGNGPPVRLKREFRLTGVGVAASSPVKCPALLLKASSSSKIAM